MKMVKKHRQIKVWQALVTPTKKPKFKYFSCSDIIRIEPDLENDEYSRELVAQAKTDAESSLKRHQARARNKYGYKPYGKMIYLRWHKGVGGNKE